MEYEANAVSDQMVALVRVVKKPDMCKNVPNRKELELVLSQCLRGRGMNSLNH